MNNNYNKYILVFIYILYSGRLSAIIGFITSYKRQPSGKERKILKKSKNTVKRTLVYNSLCVRAHVGGIFANYCVWMYK